jgi:hypothetical protein
MRCSVIPLIRCNRKQEVNMSGVNGDKSMFNRKRRQKIAQRKRNRELIAGLAPQGKAAAVATVKRPKATTA